MLRLTNLANRYQRRTLRPLYAQSQAYPYDAQLSSAFDRTAGALSGGGAIAGVKSAIIPGLVAQKLAGETVTLADAHAASSREFGLFANFVGGEMSDIPSDFDRVGVWRGAGGVFELLAPSFSTANSLATLASSEAGAAGNEVYMNSNAKGQLEAAAAGANVVNNTARLIRYLSANAIIVELLV
jgi:hypothetical protein